MNTATTSASTAGAPASAVQAAHLRIVRGHQARALVQLSLTNLFEAAAEQPPTGETVRKINSIRHRLELREQRGSRYQQFDRVHDLPEAVAELAQLATLLQAARAQDLFGEQWPNERAELDAQLAKVLDQLAAVIAERLIPAAHCVLSHLPAASQADGQAELARVFSQTVQRLDAVRGALGSVAAERHLWRSQCGVLDLALLDVVTCATLTAQMGSRFESGRGAALRAKCTEAEARLEALFNQHTAKMRECVEAWLLVPGNPDAAKADNLLAAGAEMLRDERADAFGARKDDPK